MVWEPLVNADININKILTHGFSYSWFSIREFECVESLESCPQTHIVDWIQGHQMFFCWIRYKNHDKQIINLFFNKKRTIIYFIVYIPLIWYSLYHIIWSKHIFIYYFFFIFLELNPVLYFTFSEKFKLIWIFPSAL